VGKRNKELLLQTNLQKGTNQVAVRNYNERLVLQLIREHKLLTKAEASRATGLSANAISVIFRSLESDGLLIAGAPIRGQIGQPSKPFEINPSAHYYLSFNIGRRAFELAVINFLGEVISIKRKVEPWPSPKIALNFLQSELSGVLEAANKTEDSISGMAVAMPFELWGWTEEFNKSKTTMEAWKDFDIINEISQFVPWQVIVENDGTAACRAEQVFGSHIEKQDWIYFFIGSFIGGGVVLNGSVFSGRQGNAGSFGPMRVPKKSANGDRLIDYASLVVLERKIAVEDRDPLGIYSQNVNWEQYEPQLTDWIDEVSESLAYAIVSSASVLDFEAAIIDGAVPLDVKNRIVSGVQEQLNIIDRQGINIPEIEAGRIGHRARVIGAAATLINSEFMIDQNNLLRK
jgi:predicted NBD/HSP70 family sugar kinase